MIRSTPTLLLSRRTLLKCTLASLTCCVIKTAWAETLSIESGQHSETENYHRIPEVPITIDGARCDPQAIKQYDGHPLHFFPQIASDQVYGMQILTNAVEADKRVREKISASRLYLVSNQAIRSWVEVYQHSHFAGQLLIGYHGRDVPNLKNYWMFPFYSWNDEISSIIAPTIPIILYENSDYRGSSFFMENDQRISNLKPLGWNDRISSFRFP